MPCQSTCIHVHKQITWRYKKHVWRSRANVNRLNCSLYLHSTACQTRTHTHACMRMAHAHTGWLWVTLVHASHLLSIPLELPQLVSAACCGGEMRGAPELCWAQTVLVLLICQLQNMSGLAWTKNPKQPRGEHPERLFWDAPHKKNKWLENSVPAHRSCHYVYSWQRCFDWKFVAFVLLRRPDLGEAAAGHWCFCVELHDVRPRFLCGSI